jgi:hypothetical protein
MGRETRNRPGVVAKNEHQSGTGKRQQEERQQGKSPTHGDPPKMLNGRITVLLLSRKRRNGDQQPDRHALLTCPERVAGLATDLIDEKRGASKPHADNRGAS